MPYKDPIKRAEYHKKYNERWYAENREHRRAVGNEYYAKNRERVLKTQRQNWPKLKIAKYARIKERKMFDPAFRASSALRTRLCGLVRKIGARSISLSLSCEALRAHLEPQFKPGMTWENYGSAWHVDHIKPCALFDFTKPEEAAACFALSNLQPLWAAENIRKSDKYPHESAA